MKTAHSEEPDLSLLLSQSAAMINADPIAAKRAFRLSAAEHADREMAEKTLYQRVRYRATRNGWRLVHFTPGVVGSQKGAGSAWATPGASGDAKGFPDLVLAKAGHPLAFRELKRELGKLSPEQIDWIELLTDLDQDVGVWRPSCLRTGVIDRFFRS